MIAEVLMVPDTAVHQPPFASSPLLYMQVQLPLEDSETDARQYDEERQEVGGFGSSAGKVHIIQQMNHDGEVNRARYMPQNPFIIATKTVSAQVYVFDYSKHPSKPDPGGKCTPNLRLLGHRMEGYGMAWSPHKAGHLLSGSDDAQICLWDINAANAGHELNALQIWSQHGGVVEVCVVVAWL